MNKKLMVLMISMALISFESTQAKVARPQSPKKDPITAVQEAKSSIPQVTVLVHCFDSDGNLLKKARALSSDDRSEIVSGVYSAKDKSFTLGFGKETHRSYCDGINVTNAQGGSGPSQKWLNCVGNAAYAQCKLELKDDKEALDELDLAVIGLKNNNPAFSDDPWLLVVKEEDKSNAYIGGTVKESWGLVNDGTWWWPQTYWAPVMPITWNMSSKD